MFLKSLTSSTTLRIASCFMFLGFVSSGIARLAAAQAAATAPPAPAVQATPAPVTPPADPFPPVNLKYFTADAPTKATVESFLHALWGYDPNRIWRVEGILKTDSPGVSKVIVYVSEKGTANARVQNTAFFVMPDGRHAIADAMIDFGAEPYATRRKMLQERADGPALGAASKELLLVEFSDLQCPHCKEAEANMAQLAKDFPAARIVHQPFPLVGVHPAAFQAAAEGLCVAKASKDAYFTYESAVYATQEALTPEGTAKTLADAVTKAGQDPAAIAACAATQPIKDAVAASIKLAEDAGVDQTPTISVNGRLLPASPSAMSYETLKKVVLFQAQLDGIHVDPPPPSLTTLGK
jgi:protein-disulfide isomerase